jgi:hypothetical protein
MSKQASNPQPQLRAVVMPLFPTLGSIQEVVDFSESKLPITDKNELFSLLMTMQNTLLKQVNP